MKHDHWEAMLPFYVNQTLSPDEQTDFEMHLAECAACREGVDEWRELSGTVKMRAAKRATCLPVLNLPVARFPLLDVPLPTKDDTMIHTLPEQSVESRNPFLTVIAAMLAVLLLGGLALFQNLRPDTVAAQTATETASIYEYIQSDSRFSLFARFVESSEWAKSLLMGSEPLTVFLPPDANIWNMLGTEVDRSDPSAYSFQTLGGNMFGVRGGPSFSQEEFVLFHLVYGIWTAEQLQTADKIRAQFDYGGNSYVRTHQFRKLDNGQIEINTVSRIIESDIHARNGIIHILDSVIVPAEIVNPPLQALNDPTLYEILSSDDRFSRMKELVDSRPEISVMLEGGTTLTLFVPTNAALDAFMGEQGIVVSELDPILTQYLLNGVWPQARLAQAGRARSRFDLLEGTFFNQITAEQTESGVVLNKLATIIEPDRYAANGILHVIDGPLSDELPVFVN